MKKSFQVCSIAISFGFGVKYNSEGSRNEDGTPVEKILILDRVMACRDSHTSEQYNSNREALMELTEGLMIRPGRVKHEVSFRQYYDVNWEGIQPMWILAFRKKWPLQVCCTGSV